MKYCFPSSIGIIRLNGNGKIITSLDLNVSSFEASDSWEVFSVAKKQFTEYFNGERKVFDLPVNPSGTDFQLSVWEQVSRIPYGHTLSYGEIARLLGKPDACRAVGNAVGANPLPVIIPCHRVVATNGIGGFSCGLNIKKQLMRIENIFI